MDQQHDDAAPGGLEQILALRRSAGGGAAQAEQATRELLIFELGPQRFAFAGHQVREVLPPMPVSFVPGCPASLEGVINVRGDIESLINLFLLLGQPMPGDAGSTCVLLGRAGAMQSGIRVGPVVDVAAVPERDIQPPHGALPELVQPLACGILSYADSAVVILDLERIFDGYRRALP